MLITEGLVPAKTIPAFFPAISQPRIALHLETDDYIVKTSSNPSELHQAFRLRYRSFFAGESLKVENELQGDSIDTDEFDGRADHLIAIDRRSGCVVGTYRLICSRFEDVFYSSTEFDLRQILELPGTKLEMGRACVDESARNGRVIQLLWRGIMEYAVEAKVDYLLGCSSVKTMDPETLARISHYFDESGYADPLLHCEPLPAFAAKLPLNDRTSARSHVPKLLSTYLRAGARICSAPAIDREMKCSDYLTILRMKELTESFSRRFGAC